MKEGVEKYKKSRKKWRRSLGLLLCFFGFHRDYFFWWRDETKRRTFWNAGIIEYPYCVRCGKHKSHKF